MRLIAAYGLAALVLLGCGGGGGSSVSGRGRSLRMRVVWPSRPKSRVVPTVTRSIRVEIWRGGSRFDSVLLGAGDDTAVFDELPVGVVEARAIAYATADGSGVPAARGAASATIVDDAPTDASVTMTSEIVRLEPSCGSALTLRMGTNAVITIVARNAANEIVATDPVDVAPYVDDYAVADAVPDATGKVTLVPAAPGSTTVRFFDAISNVEADVALTITP